MDFPVGDSSDEEHEPAKKKVKEVLPYPPVMSLEKSSWREWRRGDVVLFRSMDDNESGSEGHHVLLFAQPSLRGYEGGRSYYTFQTEYLGFIDEEKEIKRIALESTDKKEDFSRASVNPFLDEYSIEYVDHIDIGNDGFLRLGENYKEMTDTQLEEWKKEEEKRMKNNKEEPLKF